MGVDHNHSELLGSGAAWQLEGGEWRIHTRHIWRLPIGCLFNNGWSWLELDIGALTIRTVPRQQLFWAHRVNVRATLPPSMLFADRVLLHRGYSMSEPNAWGETVSKPLGLTLGLVYNLSRLQLTRQSLHSIAKREWHGHRCRPWWVLQAIKRQIGCRSAVCRGHGWVGREQGGLLKVLAVEQTSS